jgi:hypothetical protein
MYIPSFKITKFTKKCEIYIKMIDYKFSETLILKNILYFLKILFVVEKVVEKY